MTRPRMSLPTLVWSLAALSIVLGPARPAVAQLDPIAAKAANNCHKAVTTAVASYSAATYKSFKTCIDAVFACVQLKQGDAGCIDYCSSIAYRRQ